MLDQLALRVTVWLAEVDRGCRLLRVLQRQRCLLYARVRDMYIWLFFCTAQISRAQHRVTNRDRA
jgi:hypothetical protein